MELLNEKLTIPTGFSVTAEAQSFVNGLMIESQGITGPLRDPREVQRAVAVGRAFRGHVAEVQATYEQLRDALQRPLDMLLELKNNHCKPQIEQVHRLEEMVNENQIWQQSQVAEQERVRQAEIDRLAQDRLKAEHALEDVQPTGDQAVDDIAKAEAEANLDAAEAKERTAIVAPMPEPIKAKGAVTGQKMQVEVTDLQALFKARPDLCRIEANLAKIRAECVPEMPVPGLKLSWIVKTTIRK